MIVIIMLGNDIILSVADVCCFCVHFGFCFAPSDVHNYEMLMCIERCVRACNS